VPKNNSYQFVSAKKQQLSICECQKTTLCKDLQSWAGLLHLGSKKRIIRLCSAVPRGAMDL